MANDLSFLDQSYTAHLLLEDPRTYDYFSTLFNADTSTVQMVAVGGSDGVEGLVAVSWEIEAQSPVHAIGWRDRDFGHDNLSRLQDTNIHVFRGTCHEIENYLLDWTALAGCDLAVRYDKRGIDYRQKALELATSMLYDTVCCDVLYALQCEYTAGFPACPLKRRPKVPVQSRADVEQYLLTDTWVKNRAGEIQILFSDAEIKGRIDETEKRYQSALASPTDDWRVLFPGKEIFEKLVRSVYGGVGISDVVKSIAEYQRKNVIPSELNDFMGEVRRRRDNGLL